MFPPSVAIGDNRPQDPAPDWSTWAPVQNVLNSPSARPLFTPNLPLTSGVSYRVQWPDGHQSLIAPGLGSARVVPASARQRPPLS